MAMIQARTRLLDMLKRGERPMGVFITSTDPTTTEIMAEVGFDFVVIDGEHGPMGRVQVEDHARAAKAGGIIPLARVLENSQTLIQSTLDSGAQGIVIPHVDTAQQARDAVASCRYSPTGRRGICPTVRSGGYNLETWADFVRAANENVLVIPLIESRLGVENIDEILAVEGVDIIHFGPGDLSADMNLEFPAGMDELRKVWDRVREAARKAGKYTLLPGGLGFEGADMLAAPMDLMLLQQAGTRYLAELKQSV
jgi:4-hydroxy-2-oxoheptanedioate aldolase